MSLKHFLRLSLGIHLILLNLVIIEWVLFWNELNIPSRIGFAVVSFALGLSMINKVNYLLHGGRHASRFTFTLIVFGIWTIDWFFFEPKDAGILTEFSLVVLIIESFFHGIYFKFHKQHVFLLIANFAGLTVLRVYPNLALSAVEVTPRISAFFKIEAMLCWIVCAAVAGYFLVAKDKILRSQAANIESEWYGNLFSLISHNIRTPLATLTQSIEIIKLKSSSDELFFNDVLLTRIDESTKRAATLVNELLSKSTLVKLQSQQEVSLLSFLQDWLKENQSSILSNSPWMRDVHLSPHEQLGFHITLDALRNNSLQAGADLFHICSYEEGVLSFIDNGCGMKQEHIRSFGTPISNSKNGAGLGTFFSKEILANSGWVLQAKQHTNGARVDVTPVEKITASGITGTVSM